jgi:protein involved in polysaccharide export with SLBB domain
MVSALRKVILRHFIETKQPQIMNTTILRVLFSSVLVQILSITPLLSQSQIEAGRSVQIAIMGVPSEEKGKIDANYPVSASGTINLPFIGTIRAAGMSAEGLATTIQNAYKSAEIYNDPTIQVFSTTIGSAIENEVVHLGGQVRKTGPLSFQKNLTIYQAIQGAGGATEFGSLQRVKLFRKGQLRTYDVTKDQFKNVPLEPNDTLEIPQKNWLGQ